jgi:hypothetical protein
LVGAVTVREVGVVAHRLAEGLMLRPLICPRTYCWRYCKFTASLEEAGSSMPVSLHGKETLAPDRERAPDATEVSWAYLLAPEPREIPEVLRSMYDMV